MKALLRIVFLQLHISASLHFSRTPKQHFRQASRKFSHKDAEGSPSAYPASSFSSSPPPSSSFFASSPPSPTVSPQQRGPPSPSSSNYEDSAFASSLSTPTSQPTSRPKVKRRRWSTHPPVGVERRALAWLSNNRMSATTYDWNGVLYLCHKAKMHSTVVDLFYKMKWHSTPARPDAQTYGFVVSSSAQLDSHYRAHRVPPTQKKVKRSLLVPLELLQEMTAVGFHPGIKLWSIVLRSAVRDRRAPRRYLLTVIEGFERYIDAQGQISRGKYSNTRTKKSSHPRYELQQLDTVACNTLIALKMRVGDTAGALALLESMGPAATVVSYNSIMVGLSRAHDYSGIISLFSRMQQAQLIERGNNNIFASAASSDRSNLVTPLRMDVYIAGMVMQAQCALGKWHDAITTHDKLREHWLTENVDAQTLEKLRNSQKQWKSIETDHLERTVAQKADRFRPNHVTYTLAIDACAKIGDSARACELLREMSRGGIMEMRPDGPGTRAYTAAISSCAPAGEWHLARDLLEECRSLPPLSNDTLSRANVRTYTAALSACVLREKPKKRSKPYHGDDNVRSVSSSDEEKYDCDAIARLTWALELMDQMILEDGLEPNRYTYNCLLRVAADAAGVTGNLTTTLKIYKRMQRMHSCVMDAENQVDHNMPPEPIQKVSPDASVKMLTGEQDNVDSSSVTEERLDLSPDSFTFSALLTACQRVGDSKQAFEFLQDMGGHHLVHFENRIVEKYDAKIRNSTQPIRARDFHLTAALGACRFDPDTALKMLQWLDRTPGQTMSAASANLALDVLIKSNSAIATTLESTEKTKLASVTNEGKDFNYDRDDVSADNEITTKCANFSSLAEQLPVVNIPITDAYSDDDLLRPAKDGLLPSSEKSKPFKYYDMKAVSTAMVEVIISNGVAKRFVLDSPLYGKLVTALASAGQLDLAFQVLRTAESNLGLNKNSSLSRTLSYNPLGSQRLTASYARLNKGTYTMLVASCERAGQWRRALAIMEDMRARGIQFYENPILDGLFAQGVKVWSAAAPLDGS